MATKKFSSLFVAMTSLLLLAAAHGPVTEARKFVSVNRWCKTSDYRRLCTKMVMGGTTQKDASINAMKTTLSLAKRVQTMVPLLTPAIAGLQPQSRVSIMDTCKEDFSTRIDDLEESIHAMQANDVGTVKTKLSAAYSSECVDSLEEFGVQCPFSKTIALFQKHVDNCLAVVAQN